MIRKDPDVKSTSGAPGNPKYRPYRLLRSKVLGKGESEIYYGVLSESSLLTDAPENHVSDYTEQEHAAVAEIKANRERR